MSVVEFRIRMCGHVEQDGDQRWLLAGKQRYLVRSDREIPVDEPLCVTGTLESRHQPATLEVSAFEPQQAAGS
jgi:hypothetical protein